MSSNLEELSWQRGRRNEMVAMSCYFVSKKGKAKFLSYSKQGAASFCALLSDLGPYYNFVSRFFFL